MTTNCIWWSCLAQVSYNSGNVKGAYSPALLSASHSSALPKCNFLTFRVVKAFRHYMLDEGAEEGIYLQELSAPVYKRRIWQYHSVIQAQPTFVNMLRVLTFFLFAVALVSAGCSIERNTDRPGGDYRNMATSSFEDCVNRCSNDNGCTNVRLGTWFLYLRLLIYAPSGRVSQEHKNLLLQERREEYQSWQRCWWGCLPSTTSNNHYY